jgi:uncharacterized protein (TIGR00251 family)
MLIRGPQIHGGLFELRMADARATIEVHVQPNAKHDAIEALRDNILHVRVTAPPRKGLANRALMEVMARALGVRKSDLSIIRGYTSRNKVLSIQGITSEELRDRLQRIAPREEPHAGLAG